MRTEGLIDLHHHVIPTALSETLADRVGSGGTTGLQLPAWSRGDMISFLDDNRIGVAVVSIAFSVNRGGTARALALAQTCNDFIAELTKDRPDRFGGFGVLPLPSVDEALQELDRIYDELHLDGVILSTNYDGIYLGDPRFDRVFEALEQRAAVVFVHPTESPDPVAHTLKVPDFLIDFVADTTRAVTRLHYSNTFARTPSVRYVFSHAGGTIPYIVQRFDRLDSLPVIPDADERGTAREQFTRLYWDTALAFHDPVLNLLRDVVGLDRVVFGSDYPYAGGLSAAAASAIQHSTALSAPERDGIGWANALELFPRLAS